LNNKVENNNEQIKILNENIYSKIEDNNTKNRIDVEISKDNDYKAPGDSWIINDMNKEITLSSKKEIVNLTNENIGRDENIDVKDVQKQNLSLSGNESSKNKEEDLNNHKNTNIKLAKVNDSERVKDSESEKNRSLDITKVANIVGEDKINEIQPLQQSIKEESYTNLKLEGDNNKCSTNKSRKDLKEIKLIETTKIKDYSEKNSTNKEKLLTNQSVFNKQPEVVIKVNEYKLSPIKNHKKDKKPIIGTEVIQPISIEKTTSDKINKEKNNTILTQVKSRKDISLSKINEDLSKTELIIKTSILTKPVDSSIKIIIQSNQNKNIRNDSIKNTINEIFLSKNDSKYNTIDHEDTNKLKTINNESNNFSKDKPADKQNISGDSIFKQSLNKKSINVKLRSPSVKSLKRIKEAIKPVDKIKEVTAADPNIVIKRENNSLLNGDYLFEKLKTKDSKGSKNVLLSTNSITHTPQIETRRPSLKINFCERKVSNDNNNLSSDLNELIARMKSEEKNRISISSSNKQSFKSKQSTKIEEVRTKLNKMLTLIPTNKATLLKKTYCGTFYDKKDIIKNESISHRPTVPQCRILNEPNETLVISPPPEIKSPVREHLNKLNIPQRMTKMKEDKKFDIDYDLVLNRLNLPVKKDKE
jgi:hypothetical protein